MIPPGFRGFHGVQRNTAADRDPVLDRGGRGCGWRGLVAGLRATARAGTLCLPGRAVQPRGGGADGHAYQYIAAPNLSWDKARAAAERHSWQGHKGYLATIDSAAEFSSCWATSFPTIPTSPIWAGGRPRPANGAG